MIYLQRKNKTPLYEQIYGCIKDEIFAGTLAAFSKLPPTRQLASELCVSRKTVETAYQLLVAEGYVSSRVGSGYTVCRLSCQLYGNLKAQASPDDGFFERKHDEIKYDFWYPLIDMQNFPCRDWRRSLGSALCRLEARKSIAYPERTGCYDLRKALAEFIFASRGVRCKASQVIIGCGIQSNLDMLLKLFNPQTDKIGVEDPGYDGAKCVFSANRFSIVPIPVEQDGISIEHLQKTDVKLLYITPSHQFPTGAMLSKSKRQSVLDWASQNDTYVIEDDYDSELRYSSEPIPALQSLDKDGRVIYLGTLSKTLSPSLRLSYMILSAGLRRLYTEKCGAYLCQTPLLIQHTLADFIENGYYAKHLNRIRQIYSKKHDAFLAAIHNTFGDKAKVFGKGIGLHFLVDMETELTQRELIRRARAQKVKIYPTAPYYLDKKLIPPHQFLLGYGSIENNDYIKALSLLCKAWFPDLALLVGP